MKIKGVKVYCCYSVPKSCPTLCNPMDCSTPGFPVHHQLLEPAQMRVHRVSDAIQPSHPLLSPSLPVFSLSQHQGLFQGVSSTQRNIEEIKQSPAHGEHSACVGLYYKGGLFKPHVTKHSSQARNLTQTIQEWIKQRLFLPFS